MIPLYFVRFDLLWVFEFVFDRAEHWVFMFVRRWTITGTLDPLRNLTGLTLFDLKSNRISGKSVR